MILGTAWLKADLGKLVAVASAPVSLVIAASIFLHMITSRFVPMLDRLRALTAEYRGEPQKDERRQSIKKQIALYTARTRLTQAASSLLNCAVCSFLVTVSASSAAVIYPDTLVLRLTGILSMAAGILLMVAAIFCELYEVHISRAALKAELSEFRDLPD